MTDANAHCLGVTMKNGIGLGTVAGGPESRA